jgi:hypothetical protein
MPRYFFNLHECGTVVRDEEGREVSDAAQLRQLAVKEARQLMSAEVTGGQLCLSCRIEVLDADRRAVLVVPFREAVAVTGL